MLYGGAAPQTISVDPKAVLKMIHGHEGSTQLLTLSFDGDGAGTRMAIIRDMQFDPVSEDLLHVDLQEVSADRAINVSVAVHPVGEAIGVQGHEGHPQPRAPRARGLVPADEHPRSGSTPT